MRIGKISLYIVGEFIKMFFLVFFVVFTIVFVINFLEFFPNIQNYSIPPLDALKIILLRIPTIVEPIIQFIVLLSVIFIMAKFLVSNELIIFYSNGISEWKILRLLSFTVFALGIFSLTIYNRNSVSMLQKSASMTKRYRGIVETRDFVEPKGGIWLKQSGEGFTGEEHSYENYEVVVRAKNVFLENLTFNDVILLMGDENGNFLRRINAETMQAKDKSLIMEDVWIIEQKKDIAHRDRMILPVVLEENFLRKQIQNKYKDTKTIDFLSLGKLIGDFKTHGLNTRRFEIRRNNLALTPILYVLMVFMGILFSDNRPRERKYILRILQASAVGVCLFTLQNIFNGLSLANARNHLLLMLGLTLFAFLVVSYRLIRKVELENL
ncbi:MAG: LptF/LptG family permease [Rickettsiales bacterium]|jgi:LPS export ABC transporter permease LptG|nr:LptF/LptG family permease [Rickettsiales bacterium]